jgi:Peptidase family S41
MSMLILSLSYLTGCERSNDLSHLRLVPLNSVERAADFDQLVTQIRSHYAPLKYKEARFGLNFETLAQDFRAQALAAQTDDQFFSVIAQLVSSFHDGHVSVDFPEDLVSYKKISILATPVADKILVGFVGPELSAEDISVGDEIVSVDGIEPFVYLPLFTAHQRFGNDLSDRHLIKALFKRVNWNQKTLTLPNGQVLAAQPNASKAKVVFKRPDNSAYTRDLVWRTIKATSSSVDFVGPSIGKNMYASNVDSFLRERASIINFAETLPFFVTDQSKATFGFKRLSVDQTDTALLASLKLQPEDIKDIYAALYRYAGKTIMIIRQPGYSVSDIPSHLKTYKALLSQNEPLADVLVIDQTHNPGGNSDFLDGFTALFATEGFRSYAQFMHADRKWLHGIRNNYDALSADDQNSEAGLRYLDIAAAVEGAIDAGSDLTSKPFSFTGTNYVRPDATYTWKKPILVLANELAGSCGDLFPMMMQRNGRAKIFGERTMGLGGSVEAMDALTNSRVVVKLTRGLLIDYREDGHYELSDYIENNGVTPDIHRPISVEDFRGGNVDYVKAFSEVAANLVQ